MDLINNLLSNFNSNNSKIIKNLSEIICFNKFETLEELEKYEEKKFTVDGKTLSTKERINYCLNILDAPNYDFDQLEYEEIQVYKKNISIAKNAELPDEDRIMALIILFNITHRELYFVVEAYSYIINNR